jgi:anti-sigma B factor antagonist
MKFSSRVVGVPYRPKAPRNLVIRVSEQEKGTVIQLSGEANFAATDQLKDAFAPLVVRQIKLVVFDLADLDFLASLAVGALLNFRREVGQWGGQIRIAAPSPYIYEAFQSTNLTTLFNFYPTVEEALRS